jgi:hypothetical protein
MGLGIFMAASQDFSQKEAHTHLLLVGFVLSLGYGLMHRLWLEQSQPKLANAQFIVHQAGALLMCLGLVLFYGKIAPADLLHPILGISSLAVLVGTLLMLYMVLKAETARR